ncbi:MAG: type II secretion system protein [Planctomycetota bacterium]|jgi:prepilin-type N-terminal cleavage/methylation domain-containing protein
MDTTSTIRQQTPVTGRSIGRTPQGRAAASTQRPPRSRRGFTLIEMLTVVVIIGILASLITGAVIAARTKAREVVIALELNDLDLALKAYKEKYGRYPPDFTNQAAVLHHLSNAHRYPIPGQTTDVKWGNLKSTLMPFGVDIDLMDPSTALVFWLGGLPDGPGSKKLTGFSANPRNPFDATSGSRTTPPFDFDPRRLKIVDGALRFYPKTGRSGATAPYVYFRARNGAYTRTDGTPKSCNVVGTVVVPFRDTETNDWVNPRTFQILSAGLDDTFGTTTDGGVPEYPGGANYGDDQFDNITNFSGGTLEDKM